MGSLQILSSLLRSDNVSKYSEFHHKEHKVTKSNVFRVAFQIVVINFGKRIWFRKFGQNAQLLAPLFNILDNNNVNQSVVDLPPSITTLHTCQLYLVRLNCQLSQVFLFSACNRGQMQMCRRHSTNKNFFITPQSHQQSIPLS